MTKKEKMNKHVRLAQKHIREIEKLGYEVSVGHNTLAVYDFSDAPEVRNRDRFFDPSEYEVQSIA